jgi:hypothetical protein
MTVGKAMTKGLDVRGENFRGDQQVSHGGLQSGEEGKAWLQQRSCGDEGKGSSGRDNGICGNLPR